MIKRTLHDKLIQFSRQYPVVFCTGPRQSGKTTLLRATFPDWPYVSLEDPDNRQFALQDPRGFLANYPGGGIIDEAQHAPELFSYLQAIADSEDVHFALSGSQNFLLNAKITQSLAGRVGVLSLLPCSLSELSQAGYHFNTVEEAIFRGAYPRMYKANIEAPDFFPSYLHTYVERDVRTLKHIGDLNTFFRFLVLCAGRTGQALNMASLANDADVSLNTVKSWLAVLEASYLVFRLPPYYVNYNKRLIKSPKLYFYDTGLACSLLGLETVEQVASHYLRGGLFENLIVSELYKEFWHRGQRARAYYWKDSNGNEVDVVLDLLPDPVAIEIKAAKTRNLRHLKNLLYWQKLTGGQAKNSFLVYAGDEDTQSADGRFVSWRNLITSLGLFV